MSYLRLVIQDSQPILLANKNQHGLIVLGTTHQTKFNQNKYWDVFLDDAVGCCSCKNWQKFYCCTKIDEVYPPDSDKSINWTIIEEMSWTGVWSLRWSWHLPPLGPGDMNTSRCGSSGPVSLPSQCSTSQLLLKTRIKFSIMEPICGLTQEPLTLTENGNYFMEI